MCLWRIWKCKCMVGVAYFKIHILIFSFWIENLSNNISFFCSGKMVTTTGCVIRVLRIKHVATWIVFACANCKLKTVKKQVDGLYTCPTKCDNCGTKKFNPHLESQYTKTVPFQVITIQEDFSDEVKKYCKI